MRQMTFAALGAGTGFERYGKTTRREAFLAEMNVVVPWARLCAEIEPFYPKAGNGRPPLPLERMLRVHFLQHWFNLSDQKGNQWYFGMKGHFGVDSAEKIFHAVAATAANVHDARVLPRLLHGRETRVWGDQAYRGQREVILAHAPHAADFTNRRYRHAGKVDAAEREKNRTKSRGRRRPPPIPIRKPPNSSGIAAVCWSG